jgi:mRNA deadenylase 3'-5' endonuclease subunit Ccr4
MVQILSYNVHGLPWSRDQSKTICDWLKVLRADIVCLQEVFTQRMRNYYNEQLGRHGYTVMIPRDSGISILPSGLVMAVRADKYDVVSDCFCPYLDYHNIEITANKGFHCVRLRCKTSRRQLMILNTHTQSTTEAKWLFGTKVVDDIRKKQMDQIVRYLGDLHIPSLLVGDLNCEYSPHPYVRFLNTPNSKKRTFFSTGEDLDHIAWFPLQFAPPGCTFCDVVRRGPRLTSCVVFPHTWSDHAPLLADVHIPYENLVTK